jgi:hypothetical protein
VDSSSNHTGVFFQEQVSNRPNDNPSQPINDNIINVHFQDDTKQIMED